jgi:hypothetical protein
MLAELAVFTALVAFLELTVLAKFMIMTVVRISIIEVVVIRITVITVIIHCTTRQHQPCEQYESP